MFDDLEQPHVVRSLSRSTGLRARRILSLLAPKNVVGGRKRRVGADGDGGYVMLDSFDGSEPIYSFGVGNDVSWDYAFAEVGHKVYMYDHTVVGPPIKHPNFVFQARAVDTELGSIANLVRENGDTDRRDLIMSLDIEGDECRVMPVCPANVLSQFKQIVMELHRVTAIEDDVAFYSLEATILALLKNHQVIHIHANNWGWYGLLGGVPIPDTFELTLVRKADFEFEACREEFPTPLDRPCNPDFPDYFLGRPGLVEDAGD